MINYVEIARSWRFQNPEHADNGIVLIWNDAVTAGKTVCVTLNMKDLAQSLLIPVSIFLLPKVVTSMMVRSVGLFWKIRRNLYE